MAFPIMAHRDLEHRQRYGDVVLRTSPNWTGVIFFALLAFLHFAMALITFAHGRWEGYMSLIFGSLFTVVSCIVAAFRTEMAILPSQSRVRLRTGVRRLQFERSVPFSDILGVRLTRFTGRDDGGSRIELLCRDHDDIECPPTRIPRQEALYLALAMDVPLQKISEGVFPDDATQPQDNLPTERV